VIRTIIFDPQGRLLNETGPPVVAQCLAEPGHLLWLDLQDPTPDELAQIQQEFRIHPLAIEDVMKGHQRPKVDHYDGYFYLVCYALIHSDGGSDFTPCELDIFVGRNYVITCHRKEIQVVSEALSRWEKSGARHEDGAGFLLYFVLDAVVDDYFPVLDAMDDRIEEFEQSLFTRFEEDCLREIFQLKRSLLTIRRVVAPLRDTVNQFARREQTMFVPSTVAYFQDVYDHVIRVVDTIDTHRDMLSGALEAYLSVLSNRLNDVMKKLTVFATVVGGAGLVLAAWGMNLKYVPFGEKPWAFVVVLAGAGVAALVGIVAAWWERWL
jgi:magnesium transporter